MQTKDQKGPGRTARGYFGGGASYVVVADLYSTLIFERGSTFIECNTNNTNTHC